MTKPQRTYRVWLIATLKGGVRKSTTAMMLAFALSARGKNVLVIDADSGTQGVTDWATRVYASGDELPFHVAQWTQSLGLLVPFVQAQQRQTAADYVIIDVGGEAPEVLRQAVLLSDQVISPVGPEQAELGRIAATHSIVSSAGVPMSVLLTRVPAVGVGVARKARDVLVTDGYTVLKTETPQDRETYAHVWGCVPEGVGVYDDVLDELEAAV